jgi:TatA/E family protein of Tat protein translocase
MGALEPIHILIVLIVVLLLFGASRLPQLGKSLGSGIREFKTGLAEIHKPLEEEPRAAAMSVAPPESRSPEVTPDDASSLQHDS